MIDAYTIGISLALDDGVSDGIMAIRRDLAQLDAAVAESAARLLMLRKLAAEIGLPIPAPQATPATSLFAPASYRPPPAMATADATDAPPLMPQLKPSDPSPPAPPAAAAPQALEPSPVVPRVVPASPPDMPLAPRPVPQQETPTAPALPPIDFQAAQSASAVIPHVQPAPAAPVIVAQAIQPLTPASPAPAAPPVAAPSTQLASSALPVMAPATRLAQVAPVHLDSTEHPSPSPPTVSVSPIQAATVMPIVASPSAAPAQPAPQRPQPEPPIPAVSRPDTAAPPDFAAIARLMGANSTKSSHASAQQPERAPVPPASAEVHAPRAIIATGNTPSPLPPQVLAPTSPPPRKIAQSAAQHSLRPPLPAPAERRRVALIPGAEVPARSSAAPIISTQNTVSDRAQEKDPSSSPVSIAARSPSDSQQSDRPASADIHLDGAALGRWVTRLLERQATRPPNGSTGFDPRMTPSWSGAPIGN